MSTRVVDRDGLDSLMTTLHENGFTVIGPTIHDQAVVYDQIGSTADLPVGMADEQDGGRYRLRERGDDALFGYNLGPTAWRKFLFPPRTELIRIRSSKEGLEFVDTAPELQRFAFIGVRACELAAIAIQDDVFLGDLFVDPEYAARRHDLFVVAVNCATAAATCFCTSVGTGPRATHGYDLVLTEMPTGEGYQYIIETGSRRGGDLLEGLDGRDITDADLAALDDLINSTEESMFRSMDIEGLRDLLVHNPDHPRWDEVAARCLTCGNCTMACPTCFCTTTVDSVTLEGEAIRSRTWDSCFSLDFTGLHGHPVRGSAKARYRQWMTHKLATWQDQFGTIGCVGCGRCITWCPVGIDITEEVAAMREVVPV